MKIRNMLLIGLFVLFSFTGYSQTLIGPVVGYEISEIKVDNEFYYHYRALIYFPYKSLINNALNYGITLLHFFNKKYSIEVNSSYSRRKLEKITYAAEYLVFDQFTSKMVFHRSFLKNKRIGFGVIYNNNRIKPTLSNFDNYSPVFLQNENHLGYTVAISYQYKNFVLDLSYNDIYNISKYKYRYISSSRSLDLSLAYMFVLSKKTK
ncbi:MAG: hypothetical protein R2771_11755 [Saprospiraceae bacterium]